MEISKLETSLNSRYLRSFFAKLGVSFVTAKEFTFINTTITYYITCYITCNVTC